MQRAMRAFRTVGDITCTCPVESTAATAEDIVIETLAAEVSERGATRMDDKTSEASAGKSARKRRLLLTFPVALSRLPLSVRLRLREGTTPQQCGRTAGGVRVGPCSKDPAQVFEERMR